MIYMKKIIPFLFILSVLRAGVGSFSVCAEEVPDCSAAKSAILVEEQTGQVLYEENADEKLPIASVTKIMTLLLTAEEIDSGRLSFSDTAVCSEHAGSMDGSVIWLTAGESCIF